MRELRPLIPKDGLQVRVARRPQGLVQESDFSLWRCPIAMPEAGEALIRVLWISIDGFMIGRLRAEDNYAAGVSPGEVMQALAVGEVVASNRPDRCVGEIFCGLMGMQEWYLDRGQVELEKIDPDTGPVQDALGILGFAGRSAYFGLLEVGRPAAGETVAVSAGTGGVGAIAGQIGNISNCRTVAIVGTEDKAIRAVRHYNYSAAVVRHGADFEARLREAAPDGIDVYFDNVGGDLYDEVLAQINVRGRIVICGRLASAHLADTAYDIGPRDASRILVRRLTKQGFLVTDYADRFPEAAAALAAWRNAGRLHLDEDVLDGIERAPEGLTRIVSGKNRGKQLVRLAHMGGELK